MSLDWQHRWLTATKNRSQPKQKSNAQDVSPRARARAWRETILHICFVKFENTKKKTLQKQISLPFSALPTLFSDHESRVHIKPKSSPKADKQTLLFTHPCPVYLKKRLRLMLCRDRIARQLFHISLRPADCQVESVSCHSSPCCITNEWIWGDPLSTYMSPRATMHTVCQTLRPIRGATPRYRPIKPLVW